MHDRLLEEPGEMDQSDEMHRIAASLIPSEWDARPFSLASEIRAFLKSVKDEGTSVDSASGDAVAELWVKVNGAEFYVRIEPSNAEKMRAAN